MSEKIEVGDVFTHPVTGNEEFTVVECGDGWVIDNTGDRCEIVNCKLVRKADPYRDITLPEPPPGYRLAKWGEDIHAGSLWWDCDHDGSNGHWDEKWLAIFAVPLDQPSSQPPKSWQFRHEPWVPKQPETLADVPGDVKCVCCRQRVWQVVWHDDQEKAYDVNEYGGCGSELPGTPDEYKFIRYLDPPPQKSLNIDDVPDGRCIMLDGQYAWRAFRESDGWLTQFPNGTIREVTPTDPVEITDYIAEFL